MAHPTPIQVKILNGVDYPTNKNDLLVCAKRSYPEYSLISADDASSVPITVYAF